MTVGRRGVLRSLPAGTVHAGPEGSPIESGIVQVQVTCDDRGVLERIIERLLDDRLIACGQIAGPVSSRYRWQGRLESAQEWLCLLKTTSVAVEGVVAVVTQLHPYEVPEVLVVPVASGLAAYLEWVAATVTPGRRDRER